MGDVADDVIDPPIVGERRVPEDRNRARRSDYKHQSALELTWENHGQHSMPHGVCWDWRHAGGMRTALELSPAPSYPPPGPATQKQNKKVGQVAGPAVVANDEDAPHKEASDQPMGAGDLGKTEDTGRRGLESKSGERENHGMDGRGGARGGAQRGRGRG